jgi:FkbM family methyltransferase
MNKYYGTLDWPARARFHRRYAEIFRSCGSLSPGGWTISFTGHKIVVPLRAHRSWLDWENAVSIIGSNVEIKETYEALINSDERPALFVDVGANYGTHSVLFLSAGIPTIAFEPNPACLSDFQELCQVNGLTVRLEQVAIGNRNGTIPLVYPERQTWLGSAAPDIIPTLREMSNIRTEAVPLRKLDDYIEDLDYDPLLSKIDVEGFETEVIQGPSTLLMARKPKLIFESFNVDARLKLFETMNEFGYTIYSLPWSPAITKSSSLDWTAFKASNGTNFIAINHKAI